MKVDFIHIMITSVSCNRTLTHKLRSTCKQSIIMYYIDHTNMYLGFTELPKIINPLMSIHYQACLH